MKQIWQWSAYKSANPKYLSLFCNIKNKRRGLDAIKAEEVEVETRSGGTPSCPHADSPGDQASAGYAQT